MGAMQIEMEAAKRVLALARFRRAQDYRLGRGQDRDLIRRHEDALRRVRYLETRDAA